MKKTYDQIRKIAFEIMDEDKKFTDAIEYAEENQSENPTKKEIWNLFNEVFYE